MSKQLLVIFLAACSINGYAQNVKTGVGTVNPQQALDVEGATTTPSTVGTTGVKLVTPTIRVDGLNGTNNTAHSTADGTNSLQRVYATQNGDLVLVSGNVEQSSITQQFATIPTTTLLSVAGTFAEASLISQSFTLTEKSLVTFSATVGVQFPSLTDGTAKTFGSYFRFSSVPSGSGISTTANFGSNIRPYANATSGGVANFMVPPSAELLLPAGTYTVQLYGYVNGGSAVAFTTTFGSSGGETFLITASPVQFQ